MNIIIQHVGSPLWLNYTSYYKIVPLFNSYNDTIKLIEENLNSLNESIIAKSHLFQGNVISSSDELENSLDELEEKYTHITPIVYDALEQIIQNTSSSIIKILNETYTPQIEDQLRKINPTFSKINKTLVSQLEGFDTVRNP